MIKNLIIYYCLFEYFLAWSVALYMVIFILQSQLLLLLLLKDLNPRKQPN